MTGEFDLIQRYFTASTRPQRKDVLLSVGDDCAITNIPPHQSLVITTDTLVENIHFFADIAPQDLAYKALAVNLSDLAAMGAEPTWVSLALTLPKLDEQWLAQFSQSFFQVLDHYNIDLIGGDTTKGPLSLTITAHGLVAKGRALCRHGAKAGDWIYVSGSLGDSAAGLALLQQSQQEKRAVNFEQEFLIQRHLRPTPRVLLGLELALSQLANSAIDLSDGLAGDLMHILQRSQCCAQIELTYLPLSQSLLNQVGLEKAQQYALTGGEDYELCFTVAENHRTKLTKLFNHIGVPLTCIGQIHHGKPTIHYTKGGKPIDLALTTAFDHFK
ncbi:thiamine-phosphate kinase [Volucribacter psittacicida]|uniref:Thiamine-monophosphate kinase n=1 Tax=Volucribacter psittacicida TaxID=203482 RepID=A0A4R1G493_9PAST|nr:thiamine-phosphate kinase [Volucribacter psittacicida]TCK01521.1 thiamine-phosphate kinase [Volucribacter psittacicida]